MRAGLFVGFLFTGLLSLACGCGDPFVATGGAGGTTTTASGGTGGAGGGTVTTGGSGGQTTTTSGPACEPVEDNECQQCLVAECEEVYCACTGDSDCLDLGACTAASQTPSELQACWKDHKKSISLLGQIQVCGGAHCDACAFPPVDDCRACEYKQCPDETNECLGNPKCVQLGACLDACTGKPDVEACRTGCLSSFPDGVQAIQALTGCMKQLCGGVCGAV